MGLERQCGQVSQELKQLHHPTGNTPAWAYSHLKLPLQRISGFPDATDVEVEVRKVCWQFGGLLQQRSLNPWLNPQPAAGPTKTLTRTRALDNVNIAPQISDLQ